MPKDLSDVTIESERFVLKPFSLEYNEDIFREFNENVTRWLTHGPNESIEKVNEFIESAIQEAKEGTGLEMVITSKNGEFLGLGGLKRTDTKTPEFGLWFKEGVYSKGLGTEFIRTLFEWASENLDVDYFEYRADRENIGSWKIAEKMTAEFGGEFIGEVPEEVRGKDTITRKYRIQPK